VNLLADRKTQSLLPTSSAMLPVLRGSCSYELSLSKSCATGLFCNFCMTIHVYIWTSEKAHVGSFLLSVLLQLYGEEEHATTWKFYTLCSAEIDCSWFIKTYLLRTVQADKLLNICRTFCNHFCL